MRREYKEIVLISVIVLLAVSVIFTVFQLRILNREIQSLMLQSEYLFVKTDTIEREQQKQQDEEAVSIWVDKIIPINEELARVEKEMTIASRGSARGDYLGEFKITYYCEENYPHICNNGDSTYTSSGTLTTPGRTVASSSQFVFGTKLLIDGHVYIVEDRGGGVNGNQIDILVHTHAEALSLGVKYKDVYVLN